MVISSEFYTGFEKVGIEIAFKIEKGFVLLFAKEIISAL